MPRGAHSVPVQPRVKVEIGKVDWNLPVHRLLFPRVCAHRNLLYRVFFGRCRAFCYCYGGIDVHRVIGWLDCWAFVQALSPSQRSLKRLVLGLRIQKDTYRGLETYLPSYSTFSTTDSWTPLLFSVSKSLSASRTRGAGSGTPIETTLLPRVILESICLLDMWLSVLSGTKISARIQRIKLMNS